MSSNERDIIDRIGRMLVDAVLVYLVSLGIGIVTAGLGTSINPLLGVLLSRHRVYLPLILLLSKSGRIYSMSLYVHSPAVLLASESDKRVSTVADSACATSSTMMSREHECRTQRGTLAHPNSTTASLTSERSSSELILARSRDQPIRSRVARHRGAPVRSSLTRVDRPRGAAAARHRPIGRRISRSSRTLRSARSAVPA